MVTPSTRQRQFHRLTETVPEPASAAAIAVHVSQSARLTAREKEVLCWIAQGKRNREIGMILGASPRTIQKHVQSILDKLCVETRGAAAAWWFEREHGCV